MADCVACGRPTTVLAGNVGPVRCQQHRDADAKELARVDAHLRENIRDWSTPELEEYVSLADRDLGGYHTFCHDAAAEELEKRRRAFNADFVRYGMIEAGCTDFADLSDAEVASAVKGLGVDEDADEWEDERDAQSSWAEGQADGLRAETDA